MGSTALHQSREKPTLGALQYMIHHIILPPQLPQEDDYSAAYEEVLLRTVLDGLLDFRSHIRGEHVEAVDSAHAMLSNLQSVHDFSRHGTKINEIQLLEAFQSLKQQGE